MARISCKKKGGRIEVHDRNNVDDAKIIGEDIEIDDVHTQDIIETEQSSMEDRTRKEYMNRIARVYKWTETKYPGYYEQGTRILDEDEKKDKVKFHHTNDRYLIYSGLNVMSRSISVDTLSFYNIKTGCNQIRGTASQRYCTQLSEMVNRNFEYAKHHLRVSHFNTHGLHKGASSATTLPPSFVSVAARGEWSIGRILDVHWMNEEAEVEGANPPEEV